MKSSALIDCVAMFHYPKHGLVRFKKHLKILVEKDDTKVVAMMLDEKNTIVYKCSKPGCRRGVTLFNLLDRPWYFYRYGSKQPYQARLAKDGKDQNCIKVIIPKEEDGKKFVSVVSKERFEIRTGTTSDSNVLIPHNKCNREVE
jgi:hypothetical protein